MRNAVIGLIVGIVAGIVLGATVIAPRLPTATVDGPAGDAAAVEADATTDAADDLPPTPAEVASTPGGNVIRMRMASAYAASLPLHGSAAKRLEQTLWRLSGGTFEMKFHPPGALSETADPFSAVKTGAVDALFIGTGALSHREPAMSLFDGPPFGASVAAYLGWMAEGGGRAMMEDILGGLDVQGLICGMVPNAGGGWFKSTVLTADGFKGMHIRAAGIEADLYARLGAEVVELPYAETVSRLEDGSLDGAVLSAPHVDLALGAIRHGATYYVPGWRQPAATFLLLLPLDKWEALDAVQKTRLRVACDDNVHHAIAANEALQYAALKKIVAAGTDVRPWPTEVAEAVRAAWEEELQARRKSDRVYSRVLRSYQQFIKGQSIWEELVRP